MTAPSIPEQRRQLALCPFCPPDAPTVVPGLLADSCGAPTCITRAIAAAFAEEHGREDD